MVQYSIVDYQGFWRRTHVCPPGPLILPSDSCPQLEGALTNADWIISQSCLKGFRGNLSSPHQSGVREGGGFWMEVFGCHSGACVDV
jgi:hypothetical protein